MHRTVPLNLDTTHRTVPLNLDTTHRTVPLNLDTTHRTVPLNLDTTHRTVRLKPDTTYRNVRQHSGDGLGRSAGETYSLPGTWCPALAGPVQRNIERIEISERAAGGNGDDVI